MSTIHHFYNFNQTKKYFELAASKKVWKILERRLKFIIILLENKFTDDTKRVSDEIKKNIKIILDKSFVHFVKQFGSVEYCWIVLGRKFSCKQRNKGQETEGQGDRRTGEQGDKGQGVRGNKTRNQGTRKQRNKWTRKQGTSRQGDK